MFSAVRNSITLGEHAWINIFCFAPWLSLRVGAVKDVRGRRIPNWLTYSGSDRGSDGPHRARRVDGTARAAWLGMLLAGGIFYLLFLLGGMGGGDVKLMAAVGAWAGTRPSRECSDCVRDRGRASGGRLHAGSQAECVRRLRNTVELVRHHLTEGFEPHPILNVQQPGTLRLPYGLAIAIGTFYCVGNAFWWR